MKNVLVPTRLGACLGSFVLTMGLQLFGSTASRTNQCVGQGALPLAGSRARSPRPVGVNPCETRINSASHNVAR
jgi:hypothetical protein